MKFLSYNLRNGGIHEEKHTDSWNNWRYRRDAVIDVIRVADPDVLALQEDCDEQFKYIQNALEDSHLAHCDAAFYEADDAYLAIFVRNGIKTSGSGAFWIYGDGKTQAKIDGSICTRHATYVRLPDIPLLVVNAHLDHTGDAAVKRKEIEIFLGLLVEHTGRSPVNTLVMGDFNSTPTMEPHSFMTRFGLQDSGALRNNDDVTSLHWGNTPPAERIDYIWLSQDMTDKLEAYDVLSGAYTRHDGSPGNASDHSAVFAKINL